LHVRKANTNAGPVMMSAWFPTLEEIEAIRAGAPVHVLHRRHDPPADRRVGWRAAEGG